MIASLSIRSRLLIAFGLLVAMILGITAMTYLREEKIEQTLAATTTRTLVATRALSNARVDLERIRQRHVLHATSRSVPDMTVLEGEIRSFDSDMDQALTRAESTFDKDDARRPLLASLREVVRLYRDVRERELYPVSRLGNIEASLALVLTKMTVLSQRIADEIERLKASNDKIVDAANAAMSASIQDGRRTSLIVSVLGIVVAGSFAFFTVRDIINRLGHLASVAAAVRAGDTKRRTSLAGTDELSVLSGAVDAMLDELAIRGAETAKNAEDQRERAVTSSRRPSAPTATSSRAWRPAI